MNEGHPVQALWCDPADGVVARIVRALAERQLHAARTVVLVPYAQLMGVARAMWARCGSPGFVPRFETTYNWARSAAAMPEPDSWSFDAAVYQWRALDELLVACIGTHRFDEAVEVAERLLSEAKFPESERQRIEQNAAYALAQYELAPVIGPNAKSALAN